jgi:enterochelin esterase-like enzyme
MITAAPAVGDAINSPTLPANWDQGLDTTGYLESPWLAVALGVLFAAAVAATVWLWIRHRRRGIKPRRPVLKRTATGISLVLLFVLFGSATANAYVGYVPTVGSAFGDVSSSIAGGSRVDTVSIGAPNLDVPAGNAYVYLPPGYSSPTNDHKRYPVIYLLHGYPGSSVDWVRAGDMQPILDKLIKDKLIQPMIAVAPDASGGWSHDSEMVNQVNGPQVETYLTQTVVNTIDGKYRTIANRSGRAIGGVSSGGYGALNLALRNPGVFSVSVPMMPYGDPGDVLQSLFSGNQQLLDANTPSHYIPTMTINPQQKVAVILIAGTEDPQQPVARALYGQLQARGLDVGFQSVQGATHTWHGATEDIPYGLMFFSQRATNAPAGGSK